jgi:uncharacterized protein
MASAHPNVARAESFIKAYQARDFDSLREFLAPDIVWRVAGNHRFSGEYRGVDAVIDYYRRSQEFTGGSLRIEPIEVMADDRFGGIIIRATAKRNGSSLDVTLAEAFRFDEKGRWTEFWALANDQAAVDAFWGAEARS